MINHFSYFFANCAFKIQFQQTIRSTTFHSSTISFVRYSLVFANENDSIQDQWQLHSLKTETGKVGLEISVQKTDQMRLNKPANLSSVDHLVKNDQFINIVDDFKYIGSYVDSTEHDVQFHIGLAWAAFAKLKTILRTWITKEFQIF